jgi:hypothetical protein
MELNQLRNHSKIFQHFMEPEVSLPCSQEPSTGPSAKPHESSAYHLILSNIHFNSILPQTSKSEAL